MDDYLGIHYNFASKAEEDYTTSMVGDKKMNVSTTMILPMY
jgi:hypothetical protein